MSVWTTIASKLETERLHFTLLDPDHHPDQDTAAMAAAAAAAGTDAFMVGGSTGVTAAKLAATVDAIKHVSTLPVILFPSGGRAIVPTLDAVFFMAVLNSRNVRFLTSEQLIGALAIKQLGLETIPMGYIIVEPGMKVGEVSQADVVPRDDHKRAIGYALTTQYFGMKLVYFEAGSGAPEPVPPAFVHAVRSAVDLPVIVGGGIRTPSAAGAIAKAGADIIVTGTIVEETSDPVAIQEVLRRIVVAVKTVPRH